MSFAADDGHSGFLEFFDELDGGDEHTAVGVVEHVAEDGGGQEFVDLGVACYAGFPATRAREFTDDHEWCLGVVLEMALLSTATTWCGAAWAIRYMWLQCA